MATSFTPESIDRSIFADIGQWTHKTATSGKLKYGVGMEIIPTFHANSAPSGVEVKCNFVVPIDHVKQLHNAMTGGSDDATILQPMIDTIQYANTIAHNCTLVPQFVLPIIKENNALKAKCAEYEHKSEMATLDDLKAAYRNEIKYIEEIAALKAQCAAYKLEKDKLDEIRALFVTN